MVCPFICIPLLILGSYSSQPPNNFSVILIVHFHTDLNVLDWGKGEQLAVALGRSVYLLDTKKGGINNLCELQPDSLYVTSLKWNRTGKYLAIGTSDAEVQVCDII